MSYSWAYGCASHDHPCYLRCQGPWAQVFGSTITRTVSGITVGDVTLPDVAGKVPPFSSQDYQQVATGGGEKAHDASNKRGHRVAPSSREIERHQPKEAR